MTHLEITTKLLEFLSEEIDFNQITNIELNLGECWIDLEDGTTLSLTVNTSDNDEEL